MFDLGRYLERIGLEDGDPGLAAVHRAHVTSIPFESLDPHRGVPVSLAEEDLAAKLVDRRRGGYCFEQNLLLAGALEALGAQVEFHLARVLIGGAPGAPRPRSHVLLSVRRDGQHWHADAGLGGGTLLEPLPWGPGAEQEQAGWRYRVTERGPEYVLQSAAADGSWGDLYAFLPHPVPKVDLETANWWTATNPGSRFVTGFLVSRQWADGRRLVMSDWGELVLRETTPMQEHSDLVARERIPALLAERFELPGFELDGAGRLMLPEQARR